MGKMEPIIAVGLRPSIKATEAILSTVVIHQFEKYDISTDGYTKSRRMGTAEAIERIGGRVIPNTAVEVPASSVNSDIQGLTDRNFNPNPQQGFQTAVR